MSWVYKGTKILQECGFFVAGQVGYNCNDTKHLTIKLVLYESDGELDYILYSAYLNYRFQACTLFQLCNLHHLWQRTNWSGMHLLLIQQ